MEDREPKTLREEVENALKNMKICKAAGADITAEIIKALGDKGVDIFIHLYTQIWNIGEWPNDWCQSVFVLLYEKSILH